VIHEEERMWGSIIVLYYGMGIGIRLIGVKVRV
jgi:hypothetical protein